MSEFKVYVVKDGGVNVTLANGRQIRFPSVKRGTILPVLVRRASPVRTRFWWNPFSWFRPQASISFLR